jgi:hypothetical protein
MTICNRNWRPLKDGKGTRKRYQLIIVGLNCVLLILLSSYAAWQSDIEVILHSLAEGKMLYLPCSLGGRKQTEQTHTNIFLLPVLWSDARAPYRNTCGYRYHRTQGRPTRSWNHEFSKIGTQGAGPFPHPSSARYGQNKHFSLGRWCRLRSLSCTYML